MAKVLVRFSKREGKLQITQILPAPKEMEAPQSTMLLTPLVMEDERVEGSAVSDGGTIDPSSKAQDISGVTLLKLSNNTAQISILGGSSQTITADL